MTSLRVPPAVPRLVLPVLALALGSGPLLAPAHGQAGLRPLGDVPVAEDGEHPEGAYRGRAQPLTVPREHLVGAWIPDLPFVDVDGRAGRLSEVADGRPLAIVMRDLTCPVGRRYGPRLAHLEQRFGADVAFLYVDCSPHDTVEDIRASAEELGLRGRHVHDVEADLATLLGATTTTEAFVLDAARTLRYRGAVDDQYGIGYSRAAPEHEYLADALRDVLADRTVEAPAFTAPGCALDLTEGDDALDRAPATYHETISRLVASHCGACHQDGSVGPFALDNYADLVGRKDMVEFAVDLDIMPPWHAAGGGPWLNDRSVPQRDRELLAAWLAADCPEGDPDHAPLDLDRDAGWRGGTPDLVVTNPETYTVPAEGVVDYQYSWVQTQLEEDAWVRGFEIRPGAPEVVHHVLLFIEEPRQPGEDSNSFNRRFQGGLYGYFAAYVPGQGPTFFGDGLAKKLPAGAWIKFQMHFTPNGREVQDQTQVALFFADEPPRHEVRTSGVATRRFEIPAGADNHKVRAGVAFDRPSTLAAFSPHMHYRGKAFRYELYFPDGTRQVLLDVPRYDFNWQTMYRLAEPITVPAETQLVCTAWYDNSDDNPANPDPSLAVYFGEQSWDEMMIGYFEWWQPDA